jgi:hypothetical protein
MNFKKKAIPNIVFLVLFNRFAGTAGNFLPEKFN